jgi:NAD(P)-dependent dehydrogenase (short-subunit alcohol dehydrogenase family)
MATTRPRHVLITGGSRGIGLAIAQLFAKKAYRCTLISRSETALQAALSTLEPLPKPPESDETSNHYRHTYIIGEISTLWTTTHLSTSLPKSAPTSKIDVLVNCAGMSQAQVFKTMDPEAIDQIVSTNLTAMMVGTKVLLRGGYFRKMEKGKDGAAPGEDGVSSIINVSSLLGLKGGYGAVAYAASKAGVLGFTRALATEYASHKVRVNAIVPGYITTDMTKDLDEDALKVRIPLRRFGKPEEVAKAALFLAENGYAHNCVLGLDGGLSAV